MKIKKLLRIEVILIFLSLFTLVSTLVFKNKGTKNLNQLDLLISELEVDFTNNKNQNGAINYEEYSDGLRKKFLPLSYYNEKIEKQLDVVLFKFTDKNTSTDDFLTECIELQKLLRMNQRELNFGYDSLMVSSLFLLFIAVAVIYYKSTIQKNELIKLQTIENAQKKFSRDLHDGAAQDLAALKIYLQSDEKEKAVFYAEHAFKEVRYLIDSTHLDITAGFEETVKEILNSFEKNFAIRTEFLCASQGIAKLSPDVQLELLRILQESLSNAARHSGANCITVRIADVVDTIHFAISDNGSGFSQENLDEDLQNHYGLSNIKERVAAINGNVEFINKDGMTIAVTVPNPV